MSALLVLFVLRTNVLTAVLQQLQSVTICMITLVKRDRGTIIGLFAKKMAAPHTE